MNSCVEPLPYSEAEGLWAYYPLPALTLDLRNWFLAAEKDTCTLSQRDAL